ncbi:CbtA family protein [Natronomonas halophila]|uniref:CbtA family protein n=1 Tax=Natronomonas halophila TaxID=2747817 RepID=UPI0015B6DE20|nr:CbtA family protein [Natronomonas halophila]QLD85810.1 CbtA family protein [Natronomonas halophila]
MYDYLQRGALAGAVGGGAYGLYMALVGNPLVAHAETLAHESHAHEHAHEVSEPLVSEGLMQAISVGSGVALGLLFGVVVFGVVAFLVEPALPERGQSYLLGLAGFLTVSGVPWLVLPPAAPGVETSLAVGTSRYLYVGLIATGAIACLAAGSIYTRLSDHGNAVAGVAGVAVFTAIVGVAVLVAPSPTYESALPASFESLYVGAIVVGQLGLWGITAATHARLKSSRTERPPDVRPIAAD